MCQVQIVELFSMWDLFKSTRTSRVFLKKSQVLIYKLKNVRGASFLFLLENVSWIARAPIDDVQL